jgi:hypothetical protein
MTSTAVHHNEILSVSFEKKSGQTSFHLPSAEAWSDNDSERTENRHHVHKSTTSTSTTTTTPTPTQTSTSSSAAKQQKPNSGVKNKNNKTSAQVSATKISLFFVIETATR